MAGTIFDSLVMRFLICGALLSDQNIHVYFDATFIANPNFFLDEEEDLYSDFSQR